MLYLWKHLLISFSRLEAEQYCSVFAVITDSVAGFRAKESSHDVRYEGQTKTVFVFLAENLKL